MNGHPDDELVGYVEEILNELLTGQGRYGLFWPTVRYIGIIWIY